jgi:hypothetical protein
LPSLVTPPQARRGTSFGPPPDCAWRRGQSASGPRFVPSAAIPSGMAAGGRAPSVCVRRNVGIADPSDPAAAAPGHVVRPASGTPFGTMKKRGGGKR